MIRALDSRPRDPDPISTSSRDRPRADPDAATHRIPDPPATALIAPKSQEQQLRARLDQAFHDAGGPYRAEGLTIEVPSQFRMMGGYNDDAAKIHWVDLDAARAHARLGPGPTIARFGRSTLPELRQMTQALIDAGKLRPGDPSDLASRIRAMQWEHGIGIDCAGYVQNAFLASRGASRQKYGFNERWNENLSGLKTNPHFRSIDPPHARTGDLFTLRAASPGDVGHAVIVYARALMDAKTEAALHDDAFTAGGPVHVLQVDSSWGADDGKPFGGVRRDTWFFNEATERWGFFNVRTTPPTFETGDSPCHEPVDGVYRPKDET